MMALPITVAAEDQYLSTTPDHPACIKPSFQADKLGGLGAFNSAAGGEALSDGFVTPRDQCSGMVEEDSEDLILRLRRLEATRKLAEAPDSKEERNVNDDVPPPPAPVGLDRGARGDRVPGPHGHLVEISLGTQGHHKKMCAAACKYVKRKVGCRNGASCPNCHLCFWSRESQQQPAVNAAKQPEVVQKGKSAEPTAKTAPTPAKDAIMPMSTSRIEAKPSNPTYINFDGNPAYINIGAKTAAAARNVDSSAVKEVNFVRRTPAPLQQRGSNQQAPVKPVGVGAIPLPPGLEPQQHGANHHQSTMQPPVVGASWLQQQHQSRNENRMGVPYEFLPRPSCGNSVYQENHVGRFRTPQEGRVVQGEAFWMAGQYKESHLGRFDSDLRIVTSFSL